MELILDALCIPDLPNNIDSLMVKEFVQSLVDQLGLLSLQAVVVTGESLSDYQHAIETHAGHLSKYINTTNDESGEGYAVVIHASNNGKLEQIIFLRLSLFCSLYFSIYSLLLLAPETAEEKRNFDAELSKNGVDPLFGLTCFMHEVGHALDYQHMYSIYAYEPPDKIFNLAVEYDDYIYHEGLSIWSEYYAERIATLLKNDNNFSLHPLVDFLNSSQYPTKLNAQVAHSYRAAYLFSHYTAHCHELNISAEEVKSNLQNEGLAAYCDVLTPFYILFSDLFSHVEDWNFCYDSQRIAKAFDALIKFEQILYSTPS